MARWGEVGASMEINKHFSTPKPTVRHIPADPGNTQKQKREEWWRVLDAPGRVNVLIDQVTDNHILKRVVVSQLSDIENNLQLKVSMFADIQTVLHYRPGSGADPAIFDLWSIEKLYHTQSIKWVVYEGQDAPVHPYLVLALSSWCEQNKVPFLFVGWGQWYCKALFAKPVISKEFGVLNLGWRWEGKAEPLGKVVREDWGVITLENEFLSETTTWNSRELSPVDDYEASVFKADHETQGEMVGVWSVEDGEGVYFFQFPD